MTGVFGATNFAGLPNAGEYHMKMKLAACSLKEPARRTGGLSLAEIPGLSLFLELVFHAH